MIIKAHFIAYLNFKSNQVQPPPLSLLIDQIRRSNIKYWPSDAPVTFGIL